MTSAVDAAVELWTFRARAERHAAARFEQLRRDHAAHDGHTAVATLLEKAIADEHRHVSLCCALVRSLGGTVEEPARLPVPPTPTLGSLPPRAVLTIQLTGMCALNETVSAAALAAMLKRARRGEVHDTIRAILKDEVDHARIGWAHLEAEHANDTLDAASISRAMPRLLREATDDELFAGPSTERTAPSDLGGLDRPNRRRILLDAVLGIVVPGLERVGVDTGSTRQWIADAET